MSYNITFCTFYFDIDRKNWEHYRVSNETYLNWFKNLLELDINLYIVTENKFIDDVKKFRSKVDPNFTKTIIVEKKIEQLSSWQLFNNDLVTLMNSDTFKSIIKYPETPEMCKPLYNILMFEKLNFLKEVSEENPFNSDYLSWIDAGYIRTESEIIGITNWPNPEKLILNQSTARFFCIDDTGFERCLWNIREHLLSQARLIKGTLFFIPKKLIPLFVEKFNFYVKESIENGYIGSDEKIFDLFCFKNKELFTLSKCDWRQELKLFS